MEINRVQGSCRITKHGAVIFSVGSCGFEQIYRIAWLLLERWALFKRDSVVFFGFFYKKMCLDFFFPKLFGMPEMKRNWVESQLGGVKGIFLCALPQIVAGNRIMGLEI